MDRQEVIRLLTQLREAGEEGSPRWVRLMEGIRENYRPLHDPEWRSCLACGESFEFDPRDMGPERRRCRSCARLDRTVGQSHHVK